MIQEIKGLTREQFWDRYAKKGNVGLVGGTFWVHQGTKRVQALITTDGKPTRWAHAILFMGEREDGYNWISESDMDLSGCRLINGAQENRIDKYHDTFRAQDCAILDFHLSDQQTDDVVKTALEMIARREHYSIIGAFGTFWAFLSGKLRHKNKFALKNAKICSEFVQEAYRTIGIDFAENVHQTSTGPDHIWQTTIPHDTYIYSR